MFLIVQTIAFFMLLVVSERVKTNKALRTSSEISSTMAHILYMVLIAGVVATLLFKFKYTILYNAIIILTPSLLIILMSLGFSFKPMLAVAMLWHFMLIATGVPSDLLAITEGSHMARTMILYSKWIPEMAHNPSYNPFPTMAFVGVALSFLTGLPWFNWGLAYILFLAVFLAFDLAVFTLTSRLFSDNRAGLLAVMITALTPYLLVTSHAYQVPANAMWLLCILAFTRSLGRPSESDAISRIVLFLTAILTHPSAYVAMMLPPIFLLTTYILDRRSLNGKSSYIKSASLSLLVIGLFRFVYEELYAKYVGGSFFDAVKSLVSRVFLGEEVEGKLSLYDYAGIPFYQAFLWSLTASLACALILYYILKRSINPLLLSLFSTALIFIAIGYAMATLMEVSTNIYRAQYVAFSLIVPLASLTVKRILDSRAKYLVMTLVLLFLVASCLALNDPEISIRVALKARGIPEAIENAMPTSSDLMRAENIMSLMKDVETISNLCFYSEHSLTYERVTAYGGRILTIYGKFQDALYKALYIHGYTIRDEPIIPINSITTSELSSVISKYSMVYNSEEGLAFWKH